MDYLEYRERRLREDAKLACAYEQEQIGREILRLRLSRGWTQDQLAAALNTKQPAIARLESGSHRPSLATLDKISRVLNARLEVRLTPC
ncbi:MAG TPA: helix-turn-helix transcriptional regulator [Anaerolineae bacterium]|nr:helix-turn-helix transcriptional regulator [Anaerolineae bacterium]